MRHTKQFVAVSRGRMLTWGRCDRCGGALPLIDGDNDCGAPSVTGGECPGYVTDGGNCGCYGDEELAEWVEEVAYPPEPAEDE